MSELRGDTMLVSTVARIAVLVVTITLWPAPPSPAAAQGGPAGDAARSRGAVGSDVDVSPRVAGRSAHRIRGYWTADRMRSARPVDSGRQLGGPHGARVGLASTGSTTASGAPTVARAPKAGGVRVPSTVGRLFFRTGSGAASCSAAVIRTRQRNQVLTAGHCVNDGSGRWYRDWVFVPRYHRGKRPFGTWVSSRAYAPSNWTRRHRFGSDWAIVKFRERNGRRLQRVVYGNRVRTDRGPSQRNVRVWGYPAEGRYSGRTAVRCQGRTTRWRGTADAKVRCGMTGGSSGGPWLLAGSRGVNVGTIFAVTSRRTLSGTAYLIARPLRPAFWDVVRRANR
jgi:V8-like Glu-specific endopeptidase